MKKKYRRFSPVMHEIIRERKKKLRMKFKNAVYAILWMLKLSIQRKKKKVMVKKIVRMKTRLLEALPEPPKLEQQHQIIYIEVITLNSMSLANIASVSLNDRLQTQIASINC